MKKILSVATAIMLGVSMTACSSGVDEKEVVATVNGREITAGNYEKTMSIYKAPIEYQLGESAWETEVEDGVKLKDQVKENLLNQMINIELLYQQAEKENLLPTDEEVNKAFENTKNTIAKDEEYKKNLEEMGIDDEYLKNQQKQELAINNYRKEFNKNTQISEDEIKKYYEDNKEAYYKDEVTASHILISTLDENNKPLSDKDKEEAKKKAEELLKKAKAGEEFSKLAKENSDDPGSAAKGGSLEPFGRGEMVEPFEEAAYSLQPGEISEIVESKFGYHIIKVTDKVDEQTPYEEVKDSIKMQLLDQKFTEKIQSLSKDAKVEKNEEVLGKIEL